MLKTSFVAHHTVKWWQSSTTLFVSVVRALIGFGGKNLVFNKFKKNWSNYFKSLVFFSEDVLVHRSNKSLIYFIYSLKKYYFFGKKLDFIFKFIGDFISKHGKYMRDISGGVYIQFPSIEWFLHNVTYGLFIHLFWLRNANVVMIFIVEDII